MGRKHEYEYLEFEDLKQEAFQQVNALNAKEILETDTVRVLNVLKKLDVNRITEVEDLYLICARLTKAASYVVALTKAEETSRDVEEILPNIATEDVLLVLVDAFKNHPEAKNLYKIISIEEKYQPAKQSWAAIHDKMHIATGAIRIENIKTVLNDTLPAYLSHLENKLRKNGVDISKKEIPAETPLRITKLIARYQAISELKNHLDSKAVLQLSDVNFAKEKIKTCLDNKPEWSERSFLQKLGDVLSLGLKPLYRAFCSEEADMQRTITRSFKP